MTVSVLNHLVVVYCVSSGAVVSGHHGAEQWSSDWQLVGKWSVDVVEQSGSWVASLVNVFFGTICKIQQ